MCVCVRAHVHARAVSLDKPDYLGQFSSECKFSHFQIQTPI